MRRVADPSTVVEEAEPSALAHAAARAAGLVDDLPFVPLSPYEPRTLQLGWRALLLTALVVGVYAATLGGGWLFGDEARVLGDADRRGLHGLATAWTHPFRREPPLVATLWWAQARVFHGSAAGFRCVGVTLHAAAVVLLWLVLRRLAVPGAWLAAAVVGVHPVAVPGVAWAGRQGELLGAALAVAAVWAYLRARDIRPVLVGDEWTDPSFDPAEEATSRLTWAGFVTLLAATVLASPPLALLAAAAVWVLVRWEGLRLPRRHAVVLAGVAVAAALAQAAAVVSMTTAAPVAGSGWVESLAALPWTAYTAAWPAGSPFLYDRTEWTSHGVALLFAAALSAAALALAALPPRRPAVVATTLLLAAAWAAALMTAVRPASPRVLTADLLPLPIAVVLLTAAVAGLMTGVGHLSPLAGRAVRWLVGVALVVGLGSLAAGQARPYANADDLWADTARRDPDAVVARIDWADARLAAGDPVGAGRRLDDVPAEARDARWLVARGRAYDAEKDYPDAVRCYETARKAAPGDKDLVVALAGSQASAGHLDAAAALYGELLAKGVADAGLYTNAGVVEMQRGHAEAAADLYQAALQLDGRYLAARVDLANAYFALGRLAESAEQLQRVIAIDPRNFAAFMNAGVILHRLQQPEKAERMFRAAVTIDPRSADAFDDLGVTLAAEGRLSEAAWSFGQAARIDPDHPAAAHLAEARRQLDKPTPVTRPKP